MSESEVAIVGSGIVGTAIAYALAQTGHEVTVFEKGPEISYPHRDQFRDLVQYLHRDNPAYTLRSDLKRVTLTGDYARIRSDINNELGMVVGGSATHWGAVALRMHPNDFLTRSKYGYGEDWPFGYDDLEPYYCRAEALIGVSGTDEDNPFAPPRSKPFPLGPFELAYDDRILQERLKKNGIVIHTTPQARTRLPYDDRPGCMNFGVCATCPIGARYSPNHHLLRAIETGRCTLKPNVSVRRVLLDEAGRARALVIRPNDSAKEEEHGAKVIVIAAGAIESARLLLISRDSKRPDGIGNAGGHVGRNLVFHHYYPTGLVYRDELYGGRLGPQTGQSQQFLDPPTRGEHYGIKIDFHSTPFGSDPWERTSGEQILRDLERMKHTRQLGIHCESAPDPKKYIALSEARDRFGDPFAHLHYDLSDLDRETHRYGRTLFDRFADATGAIERKYEDDPTVVESGAHHMGTCRMGLDPARSVTDAQGCVHGSPNLLVVGGASFSGGSGAVHPTLTMVALAIRASDYILDRLPPR